MTDPQPRFWAVIPARSGSKGLPGKNVIEICGMPLIGHAIRFAQTAGRFERIIVSTDSESYAETAQSYGAEVPFLRDPSAAQDTSMEEDILADFAKQVEDRGMTAPDALVWLRPTFPFRSVEDLSTAMDRLTPEVDSVRLVTDGEPRLYAIRDGHLTPTFDDGGRSMIRRQEFEPVYRVFHTDIFWYRNIALGARFLGDRSAAQKIHKICSIDIDTAEDAEMAEALMRAGSPFLKSYTHSMDPV
jgi:CMP-N,N'-diacetyllegionaminic acid synthase